jgi:hypothetical protein
VVKMTGGEGGTQPRAMCLMAAVEVGAALVEEFREARKQFLMLVRRPRLSALSESLQQSGWVSSIRLATGNYSAWGPV